MKPSSFNIAEPSAARRGSFAPTRFSVLSVILTFLVVSGATRAVSADTTAADASALSDACFAMLNSVSSNPKLASTLLPPVASLASDAQSLSTALGASNGPQAGHAMAAVVEDQRSIESASAKGTPPPDGASWNDIKAKIAALEHRVTPVPGPVTASESAPASAAPASATLSTSVDSPKVEIVSRAFTSGMVRVKGTIEGVDLVSAGIYDNDTETKKLDVGGTPGAQRVKFDISVEDPSPSQSIRVTDRVGRIASAQVAPSPSSIVAKSDDAHEKMVELGGSATDDTVASAGPEAEAAPETVPSSHNNTAEIPRYGDPAAAGSAHGRIAGGAGGSLPNVQINLLGVMPSSVGYEVIGQISGPGIHRAGVYVDGRLVKPIPLSGSYTSFDVNFPMRGKAASIRAYGVGENFVETSIDENADGTGTDVFNAPSGYPNPYVNRYGYGASPYGYGNPYGGNPYGGYGNGYGNTPCPQGYGMTQYGCQRLAQPNGSGPWWKRFMP